MELPRNSGSSVWSGKCGWGISSDLFPLLSPLVGHVRAILLPRYTTKVVTRYRRHKTATPLGCTHSRYTIVVTHTVTHPQSSTSWTHEANMLSVSMWRRGTLPLPAADASILASQGCTSLQRKSVKTACNKETHVVAPLLRVSRSASAQLAQVLR